MRKKSMSDAEVFFPSEVGNRVDEWINSLFGDTSQNLVVAGSVVYRSQDKNVAIVGDSDISGYRSVYFPKEGYWDSGLDCAQSARSFLACAVIFDGGHPAPSVFRMISDEYDGNVEIEDDGSISATRA